MNSTDKQYYEVYLYNELSKSKQILITSYIASILMYNLYSSYVNSKNKLIKYRNNELSEIKNEWHAVKFGASEKFISRFLKSLIWPITLCSDIIPAVVLALNPKK